MVSIFSTSEQIRVFHRSPQLPKKRVVVGLFSVFLLIISIFTISCSENAGGEQLDDCEITATVPVTWEENTAVGTPASAFSDLDGNCTAPFVWDRSAFSSSSVDVIPTSGEGPLSVQVNVDRSSAKLVKQRVANETAIDLVCSDYLTVDANITVDILDSPLVSNEMVEFRFSPYTERLEIQLEVDQDNIDTWLKSTDDLVISSNEEHTRYQLTLTMMPPKTACVGRMQLLVHWKDDIDAVSTGKLADWSNTGCDMWETQFELAQIVDAEKLEKAVDEAFNERSFRGVWEDGIGNQIGGETELSVEVALRNQPICTEESDRFPVPVHVTANTTDGMIENLTGEGKFWITIVDESIEYMNSLSMNTKLVCESEKDEISYTAADCEIVRSATAEFRIDEYEQPQGTLIDLSIYHRDNESNGNIDEVVQLKAD